MPVRDFTAGGVVRVAPGLANPSGAYSFLALVKLPAADVTNWFIARQNASHENGGNWESLGHEGGILHSYPGDRSELEPPLNEYLIVGASKPAGETKAIYFYYRVATKEWAFFETEEAWEAAYGGVPAEIQLGRWNGSEQFNGLYAAAAVLDYAISKRHVEELGRMLSVTEWKIWLPKALWLFNQAVVTEEVKDITGGGANQISREATTVKAEEPPIPYVTPPVATIAAGLKRAYIVDSLLREENPLSGEEDWNKPSWLTSISRTTLTEGWRVSTAFNSGQDGARFIEPHHLQSVSGLIYAYTIGTISLSSTNSGERWYALWSMADKEKENGYRIRAEVVEGEKYKLFIERAVEGAYTKIAEKEATLPNGAKEIGKFAIVVGGGKVHFYYALGEEEFKEQLSVADATYTSGYPIMAGKGNFMRLKDFKTGTFELEGPKSPTAVTTAATDVGDAHAQLNGTVNPNGTKTEYYFEYGKTVGYGKFIPIGKNGEAGEGSIPVAFNQVIKELEPNTTYHFRIVAVNKNGKSEGEDKTFTTSKAPAIAILREPPPERIYFLVRDPKTKAPVARWSQDDPNPAFVISDGVLEDEIPGGWKTMKGTMARNPRQSWFDTKEYNEIVAKSVGGKTLWRGFLDKTGDVSGDYLALEQNCLGPQSILEDNKIKLGIIDSDVNNWGSSSTQRERYLIEVGHYLQGDASTGFQDAGESGPGVNLSFVNVETVAGRRAAAEMWYYGGGISIGALLYWFKVLAGPEGNATWEDIAALGTDDILQAAGMADFGTDHNASTNASKPETLLATNQQRKYARFKSSWEDGGGSHLSDIHTWQYPKVIGTHGMPWKGTWPYIGYLAQQILIYLINNFASPLTATEDSTEDSGFLIPQAWYPEEQTVGDIAKDVMKYDVGLDWFIYNDNLFERRVAGTYGKFWKADVSESQLNETGKDSQRLWRTISVQWQDVSGRTLTAGPPGDPTAHITSEALEITDPDHPAVRADRTRHDVLVMNGISNPAEAIEVGRRFLEEANQLSRSGSATITGFIMDEAGLLFPASRMKSGDWIAFYNASDKGYRKITHKAYSIDNNSAEIDLDAPPSGLEALLERLQVGLIPRGIS